MVINKKNVVIGLLIAALLVLNVAKPLFDTHQQNRKTASIQKFIDEYKVASLENQQNLVASYKAENKALATSASADELCGFWDTMLTNYFHHLESQMIAGKIRQTDGYFAFLLNRWYLHCGDGDNQGLQEIILQ